MSTIYRVTAHLAEPEETLSRIDHGVSTSRDYAMWLGARCARRLSPKQQDREVLVAAIADAANSSGKRGAPESIAYEYGTVTILVLTDERQNQLRQLAEGHFFGVANQDLEALDLGADFDDDELLKSRSAVSWAAKERLQQVAPVLSHLPEDSEEPMRPAPVYIVHEASGSAYWLDEGYLMACPLSRSGELRTSESVQVEWTEPEHEPAMHFVREALSALGRPTPESNPDLFEIFAQDRVDWIGAAIHTAGATYIPIFFANGQVGYAVNSPTGDRQEYLYLNPSSDDEDGKPDVFVYQGPTGSPERDGAIHHYPVLEEDEAAPPTEPAYTVVGRYADNDQTWIETVHTREPSGIPALARRVCAESNELPEEDLDLEIIAIFQGEPAIIERGDEADL